MHRTHPDSAFSLVELSIVLVILGLLTGAILAGQNLIRAAELRSLIRQIDSYMTATYIFREKYLHLPGDMPNATLFWGAHSGLCDDANGTSSPTGTCNGNGDGTITNRHFHDEHSLFWNHLSLARLVPGQYEIDWSQPVISGIHTPKSAIYSGAGFVVFYFPRQSATNEWWYEGVGGGHIFRMGVPNNDKTRCPNASCFNQFAAFTAAEAWSIDLKLDDGKPGTGRIFSAHGSTIRMQQGCATPNDPTAAYSAEYHLTATADCLQVYRID